MGRNGKSLEEKKEDLAFRRFVKRWDSVATIVQSLFRYGAVVLPFYFMFKVAEVLAGKATLADIALKLIGSLSITSTVGYAVGVVGTIYGLRERKLRRDKTEYLQERIQKLEKQWDPKRSTSRLTTRGTTNPLDKE